MSRGVNAGERSIYGIREFTRLKEQWLKEVIGLKLLNGLSSYDAVRRVLGILNPKHFQDVFIRQYVRFSCTNWTISKVDTLFSCSILRKEIPIAKKLLKALKIKDAVVTADVVYFSVYHTDYGDFVDGGLVVNHPGFFVILEAKRFIGIENADISMLHIGTLSQVLPISNISPMECGAIGQVK